MGHHYSSPFRVGRLLWISTIPRRLKGLEFELSIDLSGPRTSLPSFKSLHFVSKFVEFLYFSRDNPQHSFNSSATSFQWKFEFVQIVCVFSDRFSSLCKGLLKLLTVRKRQICVLEIFLVQMYFVQRVLSELLMLVQLLDVFWWRCLSLILTAFFNDFQLFANRGFISNSVKMANTSAYHTKFSFEIAIFNLFLRKILCVSPNFGLNLNLFVKFRFGPE